VIVVNKKRGPKKTYYFLRCFGAEEKSSFKKLFILLDRGRSNLNFELLNLV